MIGLLALLLGLFGAFLRSRRDLVFENLLLRHQLAVALRSWPRSTVRRRDNVTSRPTAAGVWRQLVQATPCGRPPRFLIRDRDRVYGPDFLACASRLGIRTILTPVRAPRANAIAARLVGTLRRE